MPFTPGVPSVATSWSNTTGSVSNSWTPNSITEIFDRLIDINGNYIIDIDGNYISLGGGVSSGNKGSSGTWQNQTGISVIWNVGT